MRCGCISSQAVLLYRAGSDGEVNSFQIVVANVRVQSGGRAWERGGKAARGYSFEVEGSLFFEEALSHPPVNGPLFLPRNVRPILGKWGTRAVAKYRENISGLACKDISAQGTALGLPAPLARQCSGYLP